MFFTVTVKRPKPNQSHNRHFAYELWIDAYKCFQAECALAIEIGGSVTVEVWNPAGELKRRAIFSEP